MDPVGTYTHPGDPGTAGLLVGGSVVWTNGMAKVLNAKYIHIGSSTGSSSGDNGNTGSTQVYPTGGSYNNAKRIEGTVDQTPSPALFQSISYNYSAAFASYVGSSDELKTCTNTVQLKNSSGSNISGNNVTSPQNVQITSLANGNNYLVLTPASLSNITEISFQASAVPSSSKKLIISINLTGNYTWNNANMAGIGGAQGPYVFWNFGGSSTYNLTINTASQIVGTVFAPRHNLIKVGMGDIEGSLIAKTMNLGTGEIHYFPPSGGIPSGVEAWCVIM